MKDIVILDHVTKRFGDFTAVDNISLKVEKGEIFGILGPNGAGKTTTINMILGIIPITSGTIIVNGINVSKDPSKVKQQIGFMTQETVVDADLTARENLEIFAELYHIPESYKEKAIRKALEEAELVEFANKKAGTFSGGMQRRLNLVRAMIHEPPIVILDEPTTGLDVYNRLHMWEHIRELRKRGTTIILTTQYLEEADDLCDRIAIIDHGKIKAIGTPSELKRLVSEGSLLEIIVKNSDVEKITNILNSLGIEPKIENERIRASLPHGKEKLLSKIIELSEKEKIEILSIGLHLPTLDDVFVKLTGSALRDSIGEFKSNFVRFR
mgnify:CR=1 FL=1